MYNSGPSDFQRSKKFNKFSQFERSEDYFESGRTTSYSRNGYSDSQDLARPEALENDQNSVIYLANLDFKVDEQALMEYVHSCGFKPMRAKVLIDRESGRSKGSAFVQMKSDKEAFSAQDYLNNQKFEGREIVARMADNKVY